MVEVTWLPSYKRAQSKNIMFCEQSAVFIWRTSAINTATVNTKLSVVEGKAMKEQNTRLFRAVALVQFFGRVSGILWDLSLPPPLHATVFTAINFFVAICSREEVYRAFPIHAPFQIG